MHRRQFLKTTAAASASVALIGCAAPTRLLTDPLVAGDVLMVNFMGTEVTPELAAFLKRQRIRGVILFGDNIETTAQARQLVLALQQAMPPGALIATDHEGGVVVRFTDLPYPPSAMALGATRDAALAEAVGAAAGRQLAHVGINWNFAPSLDVNSNPENPVIGDRSFGSDPKLVAELGLAWARGCQSAGVATCVKHFPGHGDTQTDSHYGLPVVARERGALESLELYPFREAVQAEVPAFMTAHILFPSFDRRYPATLAAPILDGLLRREWQYEGVVITDAMRMQAIADNFGREEAAVQALLAGADMVMALGTPTEQQETIRGIQQALTDDAFSIRDLERKRARLDALADRFPSFLHEIPAAQFTADAALFANAWARALTPYRDPKPLEPGSRVVLVVAETIAAGGATSRGLEGQELDRKLRARFDVETILYHPRRPQRAIAQLQTLDRSGKTVVLATSSRTRPEEPMKTLIAAAAPDLHLALWNPYTVLDVQAPALLSYGFRPAALEAVANWMTGQAPTPGVLPIELPA